MRAVSRNAMGRVGGYLCRAVLCFCFGSAAFADDYPYSGVYAMGANNAETERWRKTVCLTHLFTQTTKGRYALFHLDPRELMQKDRLRYVVYETGRCQHDTKDNIDVCVPHYNYRNTLDPYFMRYEDRNFDKTRVIIGKKRDVVAKADKAEFDSNALIQLACPHSRKELRPFLTLKRTTYDKADVEILIGLFGMAPLLEFHKRARAKLDQALPAIVE